MNSTSNVSLVNLSINGRKVQAPRGSYVLGVARAAGIDIPTLCDHPDLEPVAACRLCMVEVTHEDWGGWSGLMASCIYPVAEGIEVSTRSDRVVAARRGLLALLAARCPGSARIQALAMKYDVDVSRLRVDPDADSCILCGQCTRVCQSHATGAISTVGRGNTKRVGTFSNRPPPSCVGCGGCALVCPTGNIATARVAGAFDIWGRSTPTATCVVDEATCMACGSCEEACPFSVIRIAVRAGGGQAAIIPVEHCRGCGACVGACPSGAILQRGYGWGSLAGAGDEGAGGPT